MLNIIGKGGLESHELMFQRPEGKGRDDRIGFDALCLAVLVEDVDGAWAILVPIHSLNGVVETDGLGVLQERLGGPVHHSVIPALDA